MKLTSRLVQIFTFGIILAFLVARPLWSELKTFPADWVIGTVVSFIAAALLYYEKKIGEVTQGVQKSLQDLTANIETRLTDVMTTPSLNSALHRASELSVHWKTIRIYATSSGRFQPIISSQGIEADEVRLILRKITVSCCGFRGHRVRLHQPASRSRWG